MICLSEHQTIASQCAFSSDQRILSWISYKLIVLIPMKPFFTATQISHYKYRYGSSSGDYEHRRLAWAVSLCPWICCTSLFFIWEKGNQVLISMPSDQGYSYLKFRHLQRLKRLMMQIRYKKGSRWSQSPTLFVLFVWSGKCNDYKIQFFFTIKLASETRYFTVTHVSRPVLESCRLNLISFWFTRIHLTSWFLLIALAKTYTKRLKDR